MPFETLALTALTSYVASTTVAWAFQKRFVFGKPKFVRNLVPGPFKGQHVVEKLKFRVAHSIEIEGWVARPQSNSSKVVLYFGGRKENVEWATEMASYFGDWKIYTCNYRGFGNSEGKPSEITVKADALKFFDFIVEKEGLHDAPPVVIGRSLGTAIALSVAASRRVEKLVLISPFNSIYALIKRMPPFAPVIKLLHQRFDCMKDAPRIEAKTAVFLAEKEKRVPHKNSAILVKALKNVQSHIVMPGTNHITVLRNPETQTLISKFLND